MLANNTRGFNRVSRTQLHWDKVELEKKKLIQQEEAHDYSAGTAVTEPPR
jgi:hypothetical protein